MSIIKSSKSAAHANRTKTFSAGWGFKRKTRSNQIKSSFADDARTTP